jgi:hypothetical protein
MSEPVFQPYGKDKFYINLLASDSGDWVFGPCDFDKFDMAVKRSVIHSYILISGSSPKYHKILIDDDFTIKQDESLLIKKHISKKEKSEINEIYAFVVYNYKNSFLHLEYVTNFEDYENIKKNFNVLSCFIIIGDNLKIEKEKIGIGIGTHRENINLLIDDLKNEKSQEKEL